MKNFLKLNLSLILISLVSTILYAQIDFPTQKLNDIHNTALEFNENQIDFSESNFTSSGNIIERHNNRLANINWNPKPNSKSIDTLYIGATPGDSVHISDSYTYDGTIVVYGEGKLVFEDADALINGDILVYGTNAKLWIINSTIHTPQSYMYERALIVAGNALVRIENSTMDYYGISHDLVISEDASIFWTDITNIGFTTCGIYNNGSITVDGANETGEYVMSGNPNLSFTDATTILLWHHVPDGSGLDISFPDGATVASSTFDETTIGVTNIDYSYELTNCNDVMWGLMPEANSDVTITDSELRTIGVWFNNLPDYEVSGLVNSSNYSDFTAPLSNHNIHLVNTFVRTWSLYTFDGSIGDVNNCIIGEIGAMGDSEVNIENTYIDGSGGYLFATDESLVNFGFSYLNANFQTKGDCFGIMAYSSQNMGRCVAFEKSIMIIIQSNLTEEPELKDDAMMWYLKIDGSTNNYTDSEVSIEGSVWLQKASDYYPLNFEWYLAEYKRNDEIEWHPACDTTYSQVFSDEFCLWNTDGLEPGSYSVQVTMSDDSDDPNIIKAVKQVTLQPLTVEANVITNENIIRAYPNPVVSQENIFIENISSNAKIIIHDVNGKIVLERDHLESDILNVSSLESGVYYINIYDKKSVSTIKFVVI